MTGKKLKRVLRYVRRTINVPLILREDILPVIKWWVDASYVSHTYMRGHTGATMLLTRGSVTGIANKHRINSKISTEAELIEAGDAMTQMLWNLYFIEAQGFTIDESIMF